MCRIRLELYAHRNEPDLLGLGLLILLLIIKGVCHYLLNQKFGCKLGRKSENAMEYFRNFTFYLSTRKRPSSSRTTPSPSFTDSNPSPVLLSPKFDWPWVGDLPGKVSPLKSDLPHTWSNSRPIRNLLLKAATEVLPGLSLT